MNCGVAVFSDYDGTLADKKDEFRIRREVEEAIMEFRRKGNIFALISGREVEKLITLFPRADEVCDFLILEEGALIIDKERTIINAEVNWFKRRIELAERLKAKFRINLGRAIIYVDRAAPYVNEVIEIVGDAGYVHVNRDDVMIVPKGINKGSSAKMLIQEKGIECPIVAIGDALNDIELFNVADYRVAVGNALPKLKEMADVVLEREDGEGVIDFLSSF